MAPRSPSPITDVRFLVGVALVLLSVAGVWAVVASARSTSTAVVAERALVPGETLTDADVRAIDVGLGEATARYGADVEDMVGRVVTRPVGAGELIPQAAIDTSSPGTTTVVVRSAGEVPAAVAPGRTVDLWTTPTTDHETASPPRILVAGATVASVEESSSSLSTNAPAIELVVPTSAVAEVLAAQTAGDALAVVPSGAR